MPWSGGDGSPGAFPTLGFTVIDWIESNIIIPDGPKRGQPFILTDDQYRHMLWSYRLKPHARPDMGSQAFVYYGSLYVRGQKSGKDPLAAAQACVQALGPVRFDGWDAAGEPVGAPMPTPWIQCAANSEDQTDNTFRLIYTMLGEGPVNITPGLDVGLTRVNLPTGGRIEPVTAAAKSRLGARITFATLTESGLYTESSGGMAMARTMKRGLAGMDGRWMEPLALDTPVPTPAGWSTIGEVEPGDTVYGSDGQPVEVRRVTPVFENLPCYRVVFDDGESIVASACHSWTVKRSHRKRPCRTDEAEVTLSTKELAIFLNGRQWNLSVPRVAVEGVEQPDLPVDPYYLGLWLGDGASDDSTVCSAHNVAGELGVLLKSTLLEHEELVVDHKPHCTIFRPKRKHRLCKWGHDWSDDEMGNGTLRTGRPSVTCGACQRREPRATVATMTMRERLRAIGVLNNKHIPAQYLLASRAQRLALLRGLMDSDGTMTSARAAMFSNTNERLARQTLELAISLGHKAYIRCYNYPERGRAAYCVKFVPTSDEPVNNLAYKRARHRDIRGAASNRRFIKSVEPVASVPTRCLGIDTDDHLFVVGRHNTLTHNCTNAWDPSERSVAQRTWEAKAPGVFLDYRPPRTHVDLEDDQALRAELLYVYGDAAQENGGWVNIDRIMEEARDAATGEHEARRFFLNEVTVGSRNAVDMLKWATQARPGEQLEPGDRITLGFHGAVTRDATSLCAARLSDGRLFHLRTWERPYGHEGDWSTPRAEVHAAVRDAFAAYDVLSMMASPHGWQTEVDTWAGEYDAEGEAKVLEIWLNSEMRMDQLVERFMTAHRGDEITHDGSETLSLHAAGAALAAGKKRPAAEEREPGQPEHYQRIVRKSHAQSISAFTAALLAYEARGWAIEHGALAEPDMVPNLW
jgi:hypothetical protein